MLQQILLVLPPQWCPREIRQVCRVPTYQRQCVIYFSSTALETLGPVNTSDVDYGTSIIWVAKSGCLLVSTTR